MLKKKLSPEILKWIYFGAFTLSLLLILICFSLNTAFFKFSGKSIWLTASLNPDYSYFEFIAFLFIIFFIVDIILYGFAVFQMFTKKVLWKDLVPIFLYSNIGFLSFYMGISIAITLYETSVWIFILFILLINVATLVLYLLHREPKEDQNTSKSLDEIEISSVDSSVPRFTKLTMLVINSLSIILLFCFMSVPMLTYNEKSYTLIGAFSGNYPLVFSIISIVMYALYIVCIGFYIATISSYRRNRAKFSVRSRNLSIAVLSTVAINFLITITFVFIYRINGFECSTGSLTPLLITIVVSLVLAFFQGRFDISDAKEEKKKKKTVKLSFVPLIFVLLFSAVTICSVFLNFIDINFDLFSSLNENYKFTGLELLRDYAKLNDIFQVFASIYALIIFVSGVMLFLTLFSFFGKSKDYYKMVKRSVYVNFVLTFILAIIGIFFMFNQKIMDASAKMILEYLNFNVGTIYTYRISSQMIYVCLASLFLLIMMLVTRQLDHVMPKEIGLNSEVKQHREDVKDDEETDDNIVEEEFDPCPAFTEIDALKPTFVKEYKDRQKDLYQDPSLPNLVDFVVDYARESRLHLFYTHEDMATFIAGLGSSKLSILQGMSGTGKTSLPKIFSEAIMGKCDLIEVESSWRDKNELIGYYNEFSKRFTPRKFTQVLYSARLNPGIPTFIVLDEMNLSRIEYYFSDFLSLMEAEENNREIKLLNIKIAPKGNPNKTSYLGLKNSHTLRIPPNVWFIGTANQDESTFEISDKVYDRAQTMNFNKRAAKVKIHNDQVLQKFWSYDMISSLFAEAKKDINYDAEDDLTIQEVEKLLTPYNVSFGNRSLLQIEEFVKIYCACFNAKDSSTKNQIVKDAVENVLISKVIRKLSTKQIDNKEKLAKSFDKLGLPKCSAFVRTLEEA